MAHHTDLNIEETSDLLKFLHEKNIIPPDETHIFEQLDGGVSNRTVWVHRDNQPDCILKQALEKLRVQVDWFSAPERIHREAAGLRYLAKIVPDNVPKFVFEDMQFHILAMSAIPQPHKNWKSLLLYEDPVVQHALQFGELLARIHNAIESQPEIATDFAERKFFEELRLEPYYAYTASQVPDAAAFLNSLIRDTRQRQHALVHGDYSPKNVLVYENRLYILDYEVIHFGDPAFDIGFSMTHLLSKAHFRKAHRKTFIEMAILYWNTYQSKISKGLLSESLEVYAVRHTLACLLARVAGRSPLEYLDINHRVHQQRMVLHLMSQNISTVPDLITQIEKQLEVIHAEN